MTVSMLWGFSFLVYFYFFIYNHPSREAMVNYWSNLYAFSPRSPFSPELYKYLWDKSSMLTQALFQFGGVGGALITILTLAGVAHLVRMRRIDYLILTLMPLIIHLFLSSYTLYPFDVRLILYTCPAIILICGFGMTELIELLFTDLKIERFRFLAIVIPLWFVNAFLQNGFYGSR